MGVHYNNTNHDNLNKVNLNKANPNDARGQHSQSGVHPGVREGTQQLQEGRRWTNTDKGCRVCAHDSITQEQAGQVLGGNMNAQQSASGGKGQSKVVKGRAPRDRVPKGSPLKGSPA